MDINTAFCSELLRDTKKELLKFIPASDIKGVYTYKYNGTNPTYEVRIPHNDTFPKGFYWYGRAYNASESKFKAYCQIIDRIEQNDLNDQQNPIILRGTK